MLMNVQTTHCICAVSTVTTLKVVISVTAMLAMSCRMMVSLALVSKWCTQNNIAHADPLMQIVICIT